MPMEQRPFAANKLHAAIAKVMPAGVTAEMHRKLAEPGTAEDDEPDTSRRPRSSRPGGAARPSDR